MNSRAAKRARLTFVVVLSVVLPACSDPTEVLPKIYSGEVDGWRYQLDVRRVDYTSPDRKGRSQLLSLKLRFEGIRLVIGETGSLLGGIGLTHNPGVGFYPQKDGSFEWAEYLGPRPGEEAVGAFYYLSLNNHGPPIPSRSVLEHSYQPSELPLEVRDPED
ncbi:MAG: hypothetical protein IPG45_13170 [Deltaproteobacteria bacterium]|nr:hypothetical protein [Deltaproteobacteria bacterium]